MDYKFRILQAVLLLPMASGMPVIAQTQNHSPREYQRTIPSHPLAEEFIIRRVVGKETPHLIGDATALQFFYGMVAGPEGSGERALTDLASDIGIPEEAMVLLRFANSATLAVDRDRRIAISNFCNAQKLIAYTEEKDAEALQAKLDEIDADLNGSVEDFFHAEAMRLLDPRAYSLFVTWLEDKIKPSITDVQVNYVKRDIALSRDPFGRFARMCDFK